MSSAESTILVGVEINTKLVHGHIKDCTALASVKRGDWDTPWWLPCDGNYVWRDAIGRKGKHGRYRWFVAECNSTKCNASIMIRACDIEQLLPTKEAGNDR